MGCKCFLSAFPLWWYNIYIYCLWIKRPHLLPLPPFVSFIISLPQDFGLNKDSITLFSAKEKSRKWTYTVYGWKIAYDLCQVLWIFYENWARKIKLKQIIFWLCCAIFSLENHSFSQRLQTDQSYVSCVLSVSHCQRLQWHLQGWDPYVCYEGTCVLKGDILLIERVLNSWVFHGF